jgi:protein-disulfide isomerase
MILGMRFKTAPGIILLVMSFGTSASCSSAAQSAKPPSATDVVAVAGTTRITLGQVDDIALQQPAGNFGSLKLSQAVYEARRAVLDNLVGEALIEQEAKARGVDRLAFVGQEVTSKVTPPTDAEVAAWHQANPERVGGASLEQARSPIRAYLIQERTRSARQELLERLKAKTPVRVMLEPPRQAVHAASDSPTRGPAGAPIEMVEFSDFQCPYCQRVFPTVKKVLEAYGDRIRLVYRHFPLPNHPNARPAAEAAQCANEQGKFWPYHDRLFSTPNRLSDTELKQGAAELGLDSASFNQCLDSHKFKAIIDSDLQAGDDAGVSGTPAFFINGRELSGAQSFETFKRVIDEELEHKNPRSPF